MLLRVQSVAFAFPDREYSLLLFFPKASWQKISWHVVTAASSATQRAEGPTPSPPLEKTLK